jgi:hypothetical protein
MRKKPLTFLHAAAVYGGLWLGIGIVVDLVSGYPTKWRKLIFESIFWGVWMGMWLTRKPKIAHA